MKFLFVILDNDNYIPHFPLGVAYLVSVLKKNSHEVTIFNQDIHHHSDEKLTYVLDNSDFDFVGIGTIAGYYSYKKLVGVCKAINQSSKRSKFKVILGGHMPSAEPEFFLKKTLADIVISGEAENTIVDIANLEQWNHIKGISYRIDSECFTNSPRPLIDNLDSIPIPAYDMFPMSVYRLQRYPHIKSNEFSASVVSGRGCSFHCTFCYRISEGLRIRHPQAVVDEIKYLQSRFGISYIDFADDLTMSSTAHAEIFCETFLKNNLNIHWRCEGRLNYVNKDVLKLMKKAGCVFINYGIESLDSQVLINIKKGLNRDIITKGIQTTLDAGISPGLNFMWGNIGDTAETLNEEVDFLLKYDNGSQLRTINFVIPFPGCELYSYAIEKGLIKDAEDFYENKHLNSDLLAVNFTEMTNEDMYTAMYNANSKLLKNYYSNQKEFMIKKAKNLYRDRDTSFRGWRHT